MAEFSNQLLLEEEELEELNPFATISSVSFESFYPQVSLDRESCDSNWYSDSDSDAMSCFVTDLFENRSSEPFHHCSDSSYGMNVFSRDDYAIRQGNGSNYVDDSGLGFGAELDKLDAIPDEGEDSGLRGVDSPTDGLRVVGFSSESDSDNEEELDRVIEFDSAENDDNEISGFDDSDIRLCWDSLRLDDQRTIYDNFIENFGWEEVDRRVNERESFGVLIDELEDISVSSGFSNGEETGEDAMRYLEWEILIAVNNLERGTNWEPDANEDSYFTVQDGYIYTAEYDTLFGQLVENESALKGSPPAAKYVVENLPLVELAKEDLQKKIVACAICKDEVLLEEKLMRLPCFHYYHGDCILPWLSIRNTCPICRFELPTDDPEYERRKSQRANNDLSGFVGCCCSINVLNTVNSEVQNSLPLARTLPLPSLPIVLHNN
ncbi:E3 ubiquitin-protein ligase RING1-like [Quillaja saponaria]|uniref:RING-type E3 ubiquitin transferase n=1 Tax=Quillaja saponaria TaxID=32244 RepID=A0AAD7Q3S1_QUISA|nr:E3 ubiquitin-protein ligase RING1-like [Quillaja saponaria]